MSSPFEFKKVDPQEKLVEGHHPFVDDPDLEAKLIEDASPYAANADAQAPYIPVYETRYKPRSGRLITCAIVSCGLAVLACVMTFWEPTLLRFLMWFRLMFSTHLIGIICGAYALVAGSIDRGGMRLQAVDPAGLPATTAAVVFGAIGLVSCSTSFIVYLATLLGWQW